MTVLESRAIVISIVAHAGALGLVGWWADGPREVPAAKVVDVRIVVAPAAVPDVTPAAEPSLLPRPLVPAPKRAPVRRHHAPTPRVVPVPAQSGETSLASALVESPAEPAPQASTSSIESAPVAAPRSKPPPPLPAHTVLYKLSGDDPAYPPTARRGGVEGSVRVRLLVDPDGAVQQANVLSSRPSGIFDGAALRAVRTWRFARSAGGAIGEVDVTFRLAR